MFVVLDTNHFRELVEAGTLGKGLLARIDRQKADVFACIVALEEVLRGWLALLNRREQGHGQLSAYFELQRSIEAMARFTILPFDGEAANRFALLRKQLPRAGTMDLKIAAICLAHEALLLTRNLVDFEKVPGLRVENWLD